MWSDPNTTQMTLDDRTANEYYGYSASITSPSQEGNLLRSMAFSYIPRTWTSYDPSALDNSNMTADAFEPSAYMLDTDNTEMQASPGRPALESSNHENSRQFSRLSLSRSPKMETDNCIPGNLDGNKPAPFRLPSGEESDDGGHSSREMTAMDDHTADEPYAKLIYRALKSAPNHAMVLQEIYQWFRENTGKGSADSKGWMNSIRHNLSMNAVRSYSWHLMLC
jgi:hypothetical protein